MTQEVTAETAPVRSGIHPAAFMSRRNLVARRFIRNRTAVVALILLLRNLFHRFKMKLAGA